MADVTRAFAPRDVWRLRTMQADGTPLEIETAVLVGRSPVREALDGWWRVGRHPVDTLVLNDADGTEVRGFVQAHRRRDVPVADLTYIAPALDRAEGARDHWLRLIGGACQWLGERGVARLFATVAEDDAAALSVFRQLGFAVVSNDTVFARPPDRPVPAMPGGIVNVQPTPDLDYAARTRRFDALPEALRASAGGDIIDWVDGPGTRRAPGPVLGGLCRSDAGTVVGAWQLVGGRVGHWLRVSAEPPAGADVVLGAALAWGAADGRLRARTIFASARGDEAALNLALREHGFDTAARRFRLVKNTTARVLTPEWPAVVERRAVLRRAPTTSVRTPVRFTGSAGRRTAPAARPGGSE
jgi:hypothetical protein